uniref:Uncharacterized protein n=1 Tax=Arundo donax TaxID=35708 RepID=A0A0A9BW69_ARUDO
MAPHRRLHRPFQRADDSSAWPPPSSLHLPHHPDLKESTAAPSPGSEGE